MWTITLTALRANRRRLVGICSAVLLGVAFLAGTLVLGDTMRAGFDQAFSSANAGTDVVVRAEETVGDNEFATRPPMDRSIVETVAAVDGVGEVAGSIEGPAQLIGADGEAIGGQGPPTLGMNWVDSEALNPFTIAEGRVPRADGEVVIDRGSAKTGQLSIGDTTTVRTPAPVQVEVVGIATFGDEDSLGGATIVGFTETQARELLVGGEDVVVSVSLTAEDGVSPEQLTERVAAVVPDGLDVVTGEELTTEQTESINEDFLDFFTIFLVVFSGIALLVATFSIYNTFTVVLAQRTRESALLRAIGATRGQVLGGIALEALFIGVFAAVLGVLGGIGLAAGLDALFDSMGMGFPGSGLVVEVDSLVTAGLVGLGVTVLAAIIPSLRASRIAPLAALREVSVDHSGGSKVSMAIGGVLATAGVVATVAGRDSVGLTGLGAALVVVGVLVLAPVLARPASRLLGALPARLPGASGSLARGNAMRNPRRTASTSTALLIGVCVVSLFAAFAASLKQTVTDTVAGSMTSDLVIQADGFSGAGLGPELAGEISELPEVAQAVGVSDTPGLMDGEEEQFAVADIDRLGQVTDLQVAQGSLEQVGDDGVAVSTDLAEDRGWSVGDTVELSFLDGQTEQATVGALYERPEILGSIVVPRELAAPHVVQFTDWLVMITTADGVGLGDARTAVEGVAERHGAPEVYDLEGFAAEAAGELDAFLAVVYGLLALSIIIALVGIGNTLSLSIHERTRELGLLRAIGQTRRQLRSMVRWESVMVSSFGTITGMLLGVFVAWSLVSALVNTEGIGSFSAPVGQLAVIVGIGALVGVLAAMRPARRAARMDVLDAIATE